MPSDRTLHPALLNKEEHPFGSTHMAHLPLSGHCSWSLRIAAPTPLDRVEAREDKEVVAPIGSTSKMLSGIALVVLLGCAPTHPITSGFFAPANERTPRLTRVVVWTNDPKLESILLSWVQDHGGTVIEPSRVQEVVTQEHITLSPSPTVEQDLVRVARLVGAEQVLVAAVTMESHPVYWMYSGYKEGGERVDTLYDPRVTVRSLDRTTGEIRWTVTAWGQGPVYVPAPAIIELTETALKRATCETEPGHEWRDDAGCIDKQ